jgi:hypothetical protein
MMSAEKPTANQRISAEFADKTPYGFQKKRAVMPPAGGSSGPMGVVYEVKTGGKVGGGLSNNMSAQKKSWQVKVPVSSSSSRDRRTGGEYQPHQGGGDDEEYDGDEYDSAGEGGGGGGIFITAQGSTSGDAERQR